MGKPPEHDTDREAFLRAMQGVRPLAPGPRRVPARPPRPAVPSRVPAARGPATSPAPDTARAFTVSEVGEAVSGRAQDTDAKLLRRLQRGEVETEASLDLHGRTADEAEAAIVRFVHAASARGQRCVLVIHGRGLHSDRGAVLKTCLLDLITRGPLQADVLAFASAPPREGGPGATRLLLRRRRAG